MNLSLENKIAVVTGGAQGLGQAICTALAKAGCHLAIAGTKNETVQATAAEIVTATGRKVFALKTDVTQEADVEKLFNRAISEFGRGDVVVANAAILIAGPVAEADAEKWRAVMNVNLFGNFLTMKHACRVMKPQRSGVIVQINSKSGKKAARPIPPTLLRSSEASASCRASLWKWRHTASAATPSVRATCSTRRCGPTQTTACSSSISRPARCPAKSIGDVRQFYNNQVPMKKGLHLRQRLQRADFPGKRRFELSHRHFIECHRRPGNELNTPWKKERGQPACEFPAG